MYTTNKKDREEAARIQARLADSNLRNQQQPHDNTSTPSIPQVSIDQGAHKYVLIQATPPFPGASAQHFVISKRGAAYHRNAAECLLPLLEQHGYREINVTGGGRILMDDSEQRISIFGFSYGFGQADHSIARAVVLQDPRYKDWKVTVSNDGY